MFNWLIVGTKGKTEVISDELNPVWKEVSEFLK